MAKYEQLALPFEDEVLTIECTAVIASTVTGRFPHQESTVKKLKASLGLRAWGLGFRTTEFHQTNAVDNGMLRICMRTDAVAI